MARRRTAKQQLSSLAEAVSRGFGPGIRSPLYRWLRAHHDQLADTLHRPRWEVVATWLTGQGIVDGDGKPPSADIARLTWWKVRGEVAAARALASRRGSDPLAPDELARGVRVALSAVPTETGSPQPRMALDIRPARARADLPIAPPPAVPAFAQAGPADSGPGGPPNADEQLRRVLDAMADRATPMPKIVP